MSNDSILMFEQIFKTNQIDSKLDFKFWSLRNPDTPGLNPEIPDLTGYSGFSTE